MTETQKHGFIFEEEVIFKVTGISKKEYESKLEKGYTSKFDIKKDVLSDFNASIKTIGNGKIYCGDLLRFMDSCYNYEFRLIVALWEQFDLNTKHIKEIYEFYIEPKYYNKIFGDLYEKDILSFVNYVKNIPNGKEEQLKNQTIWKQKRKDITDNYNTGIISIDAKIDSKTQRRVQCSLDLKDLLNTGIKYNLYKDNYKGIELPYAINSNPRKVKTT